ncbi:MAG: tRNA (N(6)-L-threonylcarbamoyladenosine(37)-C(2))-methylthiotransferase MtaB [Desulfobacteraceae bacterium]|jgi:threonylcarbamoyladenosine tRNA methylthiotransferase MtaB
MTNTRFKIITLGCKVNQFESASLKASLLDLGFKEAGKKEEADVTVINTCIVTQRASYQSRQAIRKAIRENPSGSVAAVGCYGQVFPDELSQIKGLHLIAGNRVKERLPIILKEMAVAGQQRLLSEAFGVNEKFQSLPVKGFLDRTRAFLKIQDGCESFCTYCIVPFARGPSRSLDPSKVIRMLETLSQDGYKEVVLTGIHLGQYGRDLRDGSDLEVLLHRIQREGFPLRLRLSSIEPNEIGQGLIEIMATENWLCRHFHIPLQSGDNGILQKMNRSYTAQGFSRLVEQIRESIPLAAIGVDTMAGFPGENHRAYQNTFSIVQDLPVSYLHVFPYSPREGTAAARFSGQVDEKLRKERARKLRKLGREKREAFYRSCVGEVFPVLTEGWVSQDKARAKGLSDNYLPVTFPSARPSKNQLVTVKIEGLGENNVIGTAVETPMSK